MKYLIVLALFACLLHAAIGDDDDDYCTSDYQCDRDECCVKSRWGNYKVCEDRGDDIGDRCGGEYTCACNRGLTCVPDSSAFLNKFRAGTGSCQPQY